MNLVNVMISIIATTLSLTTLRGEDAMKEPLLEPDRKIPYFTDDAGKSLRLHVFLPPGHATSDKRPVVIFFFGGGWVGGTPKQMYPQARWLADRGYVAVAADYRTRISPFVCVSDGASAIRWVRDHASEIGIDPKKIVAGGGSAGGHVAVCAAFGLGNGEKSGDTPDVRALILFNPVLDTTEAGYGLEKVGEDRKTEISPIHHIRAGLPPVILFHGTKDSTVPFENAERFTQRMKAAGNVCELVAFEKRNHGFFNASAFRPESDDVDFFKTMEASLKFLKTQELVP